MLKKIPDNGFDMVIVDIVYLVQSTDNILALIRQADPDIDIILITGVGLVNVAVQFMKKGVYDFVTRPLNHDHLQLVVSRTMERRELVKAARERDIYRHMSNIDGLTGLYNHNYFREQIVREISFSLQRSRNFSLLLLDLDNFKQVNDNYGHQTGDEVLKEASVHIIENCREYDTIARYGGEEFGVILSGVSSDTAIRIAERILGRMASHRYDSINAPVTASIGISNYPLHSDNREELIRKADAALYCSKEHGKNTYTLYRPDCDNYIM